MTAIAPTAASLLRQLDARRTQAQIAALADLDSSAQDEVRRLLGSVKPGARVDVTLLIESVRLRLTERREVATARSLEDAPIKCARFELVLGGADYADIKMLPEVDVLRLLDQLRASGGPRGLPGLGTGRSDAPDDDLDDLDDEDADDMPTPKRKSIPRRKLLRAERAKATKAKPQGAIFFGPRLLNGSDRPFGMPVDYDSNYQPMTPPWLLPDEPDEENENVDD